jgi:hypothetical protein
MASNKHGTAVELGASDAPAVHAHLLPCSIKVRSPPCVQALPLAPISPSAALLPFLPFAGVAMQYDGNAPVSSYFMPETSGTESLSALGFLA